VETQYFRTWIRTCNECGNQQEDKEPDHTKELTSAYMYRKCRKCKSEALDYGSYISTEEGE
jgi:hypothetical protein